MLSNQNSSSDLTITGSLDVEIISAAESRITLKLINAPESPTDSVRFLLKDTDTRTILYPEISSQSSDTYLLDFTSLQELHEYRYTKTFRLLAEMVTASGASCYRLHEVSDSASAPASHIFIEDIYLKDDVVSWNLGLTRRSFPTSRLLLPCTAGTVTCSYLIFVN